MLPRSLLLLLLLGFWGLLPLPARSQLLPDNTLGSENSQITPLDTLSDRIDGGAMRGANLFHSFQEFNIGENRSVYFSNPGAIANILTRVTGGNPSNILGTLGVLGDANLWLINPNGIYFGNNAKLDIRGSFVGTTADGVWLGDRGYFSATDIPGSQLLSIEPGALFTNALAAHQSTITNRGNLSVGGDFTLAGGNLDLMGEIAAGGDLKLQALETLKIRDRTDAPFIARSGGELLLQGNENVDIFALNHPNSGLFSGGDLTLKSRNPVLGDIHYYSGGNFTILNPETHTLEGLESPWDPVIRAAGDVSMASYTGASLHIIAGGSVNITGDVTINAVDAANGLQETITLSDGTTLFIDGKAAPTLDIRAGTTNFGTTATTCAGCVSLNTGSTPTSANINIGGLVTVANGGSGGLVFLSNRYFVDTALSSGAISFGAIDMQDTSGGGSVIVDSLAGLNLTNAITTSATDQGNNTYLGNGGDVKLLSQGDINLNANATIASQGNAGGAIIFQSDRNIQITEASLVSHSFGGAGLTGEDITLDAQSIFFDNGARAALITSGAANAGGVVMTATDTIRLQGENSLGQNTSIESVVNFNAGASGSAKGITVNTARLEALNGAQLNASTFGSGNGGEVNITATDTVLLQGTSNDGTRSGLGSRAFADATGNAGNVAINTNTLNLLEKGGISTQTFGAGNGGNIAITAETGLLQNDGAISASTESAGNAGDITLNINQFELDNSGGDEGGIGVLSEGSGDAGNISISGANLTLRTGSEISAQTDTVNGGNITIDLSEVLLLRTASFILTDSGTDDINGGGNGGNININAQFIVAVPGENSDITANAFAGNGGNITINASAIYGIQFRSAQTVFSDITASSQFGLNGALVFNPLSFPSEQGLNELPDSLVDAESIIGRDACALEDGRIAGGSSFTVTGRGGIPTNPEDALTNTPYVPEWSGNGEESSQSRVILREDEPAKHAAIAIRPVQGWYVATDGTVHLTAEAGVPTPNAPALGHPDCRDFNSPVL